MDQIFHRETKKNKNMPFWICKKVYVATNSATSLTSELQPCKHDFVSQYTNKKTVKSAN